MPGLATPCWRGDALELSWKQLFLEPTLQQRHWERLCARRVPQVRFRLMLTVPNALLQPPFMQKSIFPFSRQCAS